jgi:oxygen-independent coproporphyrinogen-3 oxidase
MAGIYIHIPFCRQKCNYCNFYFSTSLLHKRDLVEGIALELLQRKSMFEGQVLSSIYFGGGTPSLLDEAELMLLQDTIYRHYQIADDAEISLEANPDDLSKTMLNTLKASAVNRLSIGIQSFQEEDLRYMNRVHSAMEGEDAVKRSQDVGLSNISLDLIYGTPTLNNAQWQQNITKAASLGVRHLSSYALTVEQNTPLFQSIKKGKLPAVDELKSAEQMMILMNIAPELGFEQYEISNFAQAGAIARHNSAYWFGEAYLGVGPAAHSFDGQLKRRWNVSSNMKYLQQLHAGGAYFEEEVLSMEDRFNEMIMTGLRTKWGVSLDKLQAEFGKENCEHMLPILEEQFAGTYQIENNQLKLNTAGKLLADAIAAELFQDK